MKESKAIQHINEIFEHLGSHPTPQHRKLSILYSRGDLFLIGTSAILFLAGLTLGLIYRFTAHQFAYVLGAARVALSLAVVEGWILQLKGMAHAAKFFLHPVQSLLTAQVKHAQSDHELLRRLREYPIPILEYVGRRLNMEVQHLRGRITMTTGAIDKVGVIPLLVGLISSGGWTSSTQNATKADIVTATAGFGLVYMLSVITMLASNRIEELVQLIEFALQDSKHPSRELSGSNNGHSVQILPSRKPESTP